MKKKRVTLIAAIALVAVGTLALVTYVNKAEDRALAGEELVDVLVANGEIPQGTSANELSAYVRVESVPTKVKAADALAGVEDADGMVTKVELTDGEQLTSNKLVTAEEYNQLQARVGRGGGEVSVPEGLLEITIALDPVRTVGGTLRPGDLVGVIASFDALEAEDETLDGEDVSGFLLNKVLVTNVQGTPVADPTRQATAEDRTPVPAGSLFVTVAVDAPSAERLVFATNYGNLWLAVQPTDATESGDSVLTDDNIFG